MLQTKIVDGLTRSEVETALNEALSKINSEKVTVKWPDPRCLIAVIEYELEEAWRKEICCDCKYYDDTDSDNGVIGLCQERGKRTRFNCRACKEFKDVRS